MTYFHELIKKGTILVAFAVILFTSCGPPPPQRVDRFVNVFVKLRPDLSEDDEVWEVLGEYKYYSKYSTSPSYGDLPLAMRKYAAKKSEAEGYDCFIILSESDASKYQSYTRTKKKTMEGRANTSGSANYQSNHYNNWGYGNTQGTINSYDNTDYSYEVPVTETVNSTMAGLMWLVSFKKADVCEELKKSKWRENVYYSKYLLEKIEQLEQGSFR